MANDTVADIEPLEFHSCNTPRGMLYYNMGDLTDFQQTKLNELKIRTVREDEQYLADHPEIRACIALVTRHVMKLLPRDRIHETVAQFFARSRIDIEEEVKQYVAEMDPHLCEGASAVGLFARPSSTASSFDDMSTFSDEEEIGSECSGSLKNIDVNIQDLPNYPSNAIINSISQITHNVDRHVDQEKLKKSVLESMMEDVIVQEVLHKMPYGPDEEEEVLNEGETPNLSQRVSFCLKVDVLTDHPPPVGRSTTSLQDPASDEPAVDQPFEEETSVLNTVSAEQGSLATVGIEEIVDGADIISTTTAETYDTSLYSSAGASQASGDLHEEDAV